MIKKINKFTVIIILFSCFVQTIFALDEKDILLRQANQLSGRRKFERANQIYETLLGKYPKDYKIAERLIQNYIVTSEIDKADIIINKYRTIFPEKNYVKSKLLILLANGDINNSAKIVDKYFSKSDINVYEYGEISSVFETYKFYKKAVELYKKARTVSDSKDIYAKELAIDYQKMQNFHKAIDEYLKYLEKNPNYLHYFLKQFQNILKKDDSQIDYIASKVKKSKSPYVIEIYALSLSYLGKYNEALKIYDKLDSTKLLNYAKQLAVLKKNMIALQAYEMFLNKDKHSNQKPYVEIQIAKLLMDENKIDSAYTRLMEMRNNKKYNSLKNRAAFQANRECRGLLAEISIRQNKPDEEVIKYFTEAKKYTNNLSEKYLLEYKIVHYQMMKGDYQTSKRSLKFLLSQQVKGSKTYSLGLYNEYLYSMLTDDPKRDSLLTEIIISIPENKIVNNVLWMENLLKSISKGDQELFKTAFKDKELYKIGDAIELLLKGKDENMHMTALNWALENNMQEEIAEILALKFKNEDYEQFVRLLRDKTGSKEAIKDITEFLQENPNSVWSPSFRKIIESKR